MNLSPDEAAQALKEIETSRTRMQAAIRSHRGHLFLWIWGLDWIVISLHDGMTAPSALFSNIVSGFGVLVTVAVGFLQSRQIRSPINKRFIAVVATLLLFGYGAYPMIFGGFRSYQAAFGYSTLLWMQVYIIGGIWFQNYWRWVGLLSAAMIVAGFIFFPAYFWTSTLFCGCVLFGSGFYVRYLWK